MAGVDRGSVQRSDIRVGLSGPARVGYLLGVCLVVAGGLVAAVTGPLELDRGSWLAAYLVLVGGVAQGLLATAQSALATSPVHPRVWWA